MRIRSDIAVLGTFALLELAGGIAMLFVLVHLLEPQPAVPDLVGATPGKVLTQNTDPELDASVAQADGDLDEGQLCPLEVVLAPEDGKTIDEAFVAAWGHVGPDARQFDLRGRHSEGSAWLIDDCPCAVASLKVHVKGYVVVRRRNVDVAVERSVTVPLVRGIRIRGVVSDLEGEPIPGANVSAGDASDDADKAGKYVLRADPAEVREVRASAEGFLDGRERLRLDPDAVDDVTLDLALDRARSVTVWCAGLPDDSCAPVIGLMCTWPLLPIGNPCWGDPMTCTCPKGRVAIRGGGTSVEVPPDAKEAWLDFRAGGRITGQAVEGEEPAVCDVTGMRLPGAIPDLKNGFVAFNTGKCDSEGRFTLSGLAPGRWRVEVRHGELERTIAAVLIRAGQENDVGIVELGGGGAIEGVVIDALTDQGAPGEAVGAIRQGQNPESPDMHMAESASEGRFRLQGLDDGDYSVYLAARPFSRVSATVKDGRCNKEVTLETGEANLLADNGFSLETDNAGDLVVLRVDPGGSAAANGLESGDRIDGVLIGGVDPGSLLPGMEDEITDFVLDHWPGWGITLVVERRGQSVEVPLD